jgi:hypothetical protein
VERFGTRHKAALGITEQTDAIVVVVSEESGQMSLVERARIVRNLDEPKLTRALAALLHPQTAGGLLLQERAAPRRVRPSFRQLARRARFGRVRGSAGPTANARGDVRPPRSDDASGEEKASS